ncbi:MAG: hypothetical protein K2K90_18080 [Lachnospiraceae bacterium]|nr:hypothetical protein [Lachnospiraceae bacterium]
MRLYRKYQNFIEKWLFPAILLLYPFLVVNQGLDVADSTYSLTNFQYFDSMEGTWMVATFFSNAVGWLFMHLPFGGTLLGMKCYTTLVQSATALMVYFGLRKQIAAPLLFFGEFLALGLCWCPSTILYNYLTYFFMTAAVLLLYRGLVPAGTSVSGKKQRLCFAAAGICLGANVSVRMPNVVQAAFILAVWYGTVLTFRRRVGKAGGSLGAGVTADAENRNAGQEGTGKRPLPGRELAVITGWCLLGYAAGFGVPLAVICVRYGVSAYPDMVRTMFAMTEQAADYKPSSMLSGMFADYIKGLYWLTFAGVCASAAGLALRVRERLYGAGTSTGQQDSGKNDVCAKEQTGELSRKWDVYRITGIIIKTAYVLLLLVLLRFYWGRGMFHFRYYQYGNGCIYYPTVLLLLVMIAVAVFCLIEKRVCAEQKILAAFVLLQIFLTPLGSNTDLYPIINNLFVAAPFLLWVMWSRFTCWRVEGGETGLTTAKDAANPGTSVRLVRQRWMGQYRFLWTAPFCGLLVFVLVQSVGSHANFVFQDGIYGETRDMRVKMPEKAVGIYTNLENGALLEELSVFIKEEGLTGREMITYGELPGLYYLLDMPPALSTGWPDLESYRMTEYMRDLAELEKEIVAGGEMPVIIVSSSVAAYWSDDGEAISWFGVDVEKMAEDKKQRILGEWIGNYGYTERFGNMRYVVYVQ